MHEPVLCAEAVALLSPRGDGLYVDCTLGLGGHTAALLDAGAGQVIGIDRDPAALAHSRERLAAYGDRVRFVHADYRDLPFVLASTGVTAVDGALADFGVSSMQLDDAARGFSFRHDGPLDMRMDPTKGASLADRIATVDEGTLADVIYQFGEERHARRVARAIVRARETEPFERTAQLASVVRRASGGGTWQRLDPATRTFQALRIWVNDELSGIDAFLHAAMAALVIGGRLVVIAFHSLEDRIVKHTFRAAAGDESDASHGAVRMRLVMRRAVMPSDEEQERNPRARSARLRAVERVA